LILYGIIGGTSAGLDFLIYTFLIGLNTYYIVANGIGIHCGIFCSFVLNRRFNFKIKDKPLVRFLSFYLIGLIGLLLSSFLLWLMVTRWGWDKIYAKLLTIFVVAVVQFLFNKYITFKSTK
jgi:putative flippase GtrA